MTVPVITVYFDANPAQAGEWVLDTSILNGTDGLADSPRWIDATVTDLPLSGSIVRGRQNVDSPVQAGECTLVCDNRSGNFDPDNPYSVFNSNPPGLAKGMLCQVKETFNAVVRTLFTGRLDNVTLDKEYDLSATLTFLDDLAAAGATAMTSYNDAVRPESTLSRATWLARMLPKLSGTPSISAALTRTLLPTYGGSSVLDMLDLVGNAEAGRVFVDRAGVLTVTAHVDDLTGTVLAYLSDDPMDLAAGALDYEVLATSSARTQVVAGAIVDRYNRDDSNYPSVYGGDAAAQDLYQGATVSVVAPLAVDDDAQALATYMGTRRARPIPGVDAVTVRITGQPTAASSTVAALCSADLGDQLAVHRTVAYTTGAQILDLQANIEGIRWDFPEVGQLSGTFYLSLADIVSLYGGAGPFTLNTSQLDGLDVLTAY